MSDLESSLTEFSIGSNVNLFAIHSLDERLESGREGTKFNLILKNPRNIGGERGNVSPQLKFFAKEYSSMDEVEQVLARFTELHNIGFATPATFRYFNFDGKHLLLLTDMTEGGRYNVWSWNYDTNREELDSLIRINPTSQELTEVLQPVIELANEHDIRLTPDAVLFRRDTSGGNLEVFLVDVSGIKSDAYPHVQNSTLIPTLADVIIKICHKSYE